jgi:hypothetical protein
VSGSIEHTRPVPSAAVLTSYSRAISRWQAPQVSGMCILLTRAEASKPRPAAPAGVPAAEPVPAAARTPASAKAAVWAACVIAALPAVWAAFLTFYGGFVILFLLAFTGLTLSTGPPRQDKSTIAS